MLGLGASSLNNGASSRGTPRSTCLTARNYLNTQYTVPVTVGNTSFWMVPDSGSFELLVPSASCSECRCLDSSSQCCTEARTDNKQTYAQPALSQRQVTMTFGQGPVMGTITSDSVRVNELSTNNQSVVLINEHKVQGYCESSYDGVLGLGHRKYARESDQDTALLTTLGMDSFSICFGRNTDEPGRLIVGGGLPRLRYYDIPVIGTRHWAVQMMGASFGGGSTGRVCDRPPYCGAIIDSGTSLLAGPRELVASMLDGLGQPVAEDCSNVHDLPNLVLQLGPPGQQLNITLTPDIYVTRTKELWDSSAAASAAALLDLGGASAVASLGIGHATLMRAPSSRARSRPAAGFAVSAGGRRPRLLGSPGRRKSAFWRASTTLLAQSDGPLNGSSGGVGAAEPAKEYCSVVFMELGMTDQDYGPVWILGVPFMRAYSAQFKRGDSDGTEGLVRNHTTPAEAPRGTEPPQPPTPPGDEPAVRVRGNHSGLYIGFAEIPTAHNPCAGCDAALPPARIAGRLARHHTLLAGGVFGGSQSSRGGAPQPVGLRRPMSVSLQHARLPAWAEEESSRQSRALDAELPRRVRNFL